MLERYGHGGDLRTAREAFGLAEDEFLDFSSNMNPFGPPPAAERIYRERWHDVVRYPDPAVRELRQKLAGIYGIPEDCILAGNGAAELIDLAVRVLKPAVTALARPSFSEYEEAAAKTGSKLLDIPLREENGFMLQERDLDEAMKQADLLFLGHPNNPTGRTLPVSALDRLAGSDRMVILDEAFLDFSPREAELTRIRQAAQAGNLFVIRSLTKFYAIPGIRLGFIVARPDWIAALRRLQVPWSVNFLAQAVGRAVLDDREYAVRTREWLERERPWLSGRLEALGCRVVPSETNYLLFSLPVDSGMDVKRLQRLLGARGILVRDASLFAGLDSRYVRIAVRRREENERLLRGLEEAFAAERDIRGGTPGRGSEPASGREASRR